MVYIKSVKKLFLISLFLLLIASPSVLALSEEELDKELSKDMSADESKEIEDSNSSWDISGFLESLNHFSIPDRDKDDMSKYKIIKLESHGRLNAKYGSDGCYGKAVMDIYFYPDRKDENSSAEDWKEPRDSGAIEAQELYLKGGEYFQFKIGKQLFSWGTADMFQITNYFDQPDQREFFAIDRDERYEGIPALSFKLLIGNFSIETAAAPVHSPALMPEEGSFWYLCPHPIVTPAGNLPVIIKEENKLPETIDNSSYALRTGGTIENLDFHLSYYNGINRNILFKPEVTGSSLADASIEMSPYYDRIQAFGLDLAYTISKISFRGEALYSSDMPAIKEIDAMALQTGINQIISIGSNNIEISAIEKIPFFSYVVGADYNLWGDNGLVLIEWMNGKYLKDENDYTKPFINTMLLVRIQDKFFNESLEAEIGSILRPVQKEFGYAVTGELTLNFKNGLKVGAGCILFAGKGDDLFSLFDNKDMVYLKARMQF